jgi:hypothetical protein
VRIMTRSLFAVLLVSFTAASCKTAQEPGTGATSGTSTSQPTSAPVLSQEHPGLGLRSPVLLYEGDDLQPSPTASLLEVVGLHVHEVGVSLGGGGEHDDAGLAGGDSIGDGHVVHVGLGGIEGVNLLDVEDIAEDRLDRAGRRVAHADAEPTRSRAPWSSCRV